ncbi:uncharacterized protein [Dysidea avara]|uniref:uncharacterized protein isoform X2 n=1 Tax=Dysidea avara TaxID=196820 RepID=UPI0033281869
MATIVRRNRCLFRKRPVNRRIINVIIGVSASVSSSNSSSSNSSINSSTSSSSSCETVVHYCTCLESVKPPPHAYVCSTLSGNCDQSFIVEGLERIGYYQPSVPYLNFIPKISPLAKRWNLHFFIVFTDTVNISLLYKQWPPFLQNEETIMFFNQPKTLGGSFSTRVPQKYEWFFIKLIITGAATDDLKIKLNYFVLAKFVISWVPSPTTSMICSNASPTPSPSLEVLPTTEVEDENVQVNITMSVGNVWNNTITIPVTSPLGAYTIIAVLPTTEVEDENVQVNITMSVGNVWNNTITIPVTSPLDMVTSSTNNNECSTALWMFYAAGGCAVIIIIALTITVILFMLKIHQYKKCITSNHKGKVLAGIKHESNSTK